MGRGRISTTSGTRVIDTGNGGREIRFDLKGAWIESSAVEHKAIGACIDAGGYFGQPADSRQRS